MIAQYHYEDCNGYRYEFINGKLNTTNLSKERIQKVINNGTVGIVAMKWKAQKLNKCS